ncbi:MAG: HU family DNA-binding protein [Bacteroidales bacterium]|nr:HU family DNA-binding protein [Bacteroidales bacterium]
MADKLSWSELRRALAQRANISEKDANTFLTAFNAQLLEALKTEKQVKINGLGTFKLQAVAPRKSVDVTTGNEITIEGYNKVSFVPEAGVKELVEKVEASEAVEALDPIQKLGAQADEIVDILGDLGELPKEEKAEEPVEETAPVEEPKAEEPVAEKPKEEEPKVEEPVEETAPVEEPKEEEPVEEVAPVEESKEEEPVIAEVPAEDPKEEEPKEEEPIEEAAPVEEPKEEEPLIVSEKPAKKKNYFLRALLISLIILLILCVVGYFFLRKQVCEWFDILKEKVEKIELFNKCSAPSEEVKAAAAEDELVLEVPEEAAEQVAESEAPKAEVQKAKYEELLLTEEITEGSRLAWISRKYYGHPDYWPYLYDANRDRIDDPSNVPVGTQIRVPKLTKAQRDMTSSEYLRLKEEAVAAIR